MICTVFRPRRIKDGKIAVARMYRGRYRLGNESKVIDVPLHTNDKRVAQQRLEEIVQERQLESVGLLSPQAIRQAQQTPLTTHLKHYLADLRALGRNGEYVYIIGRTVTKLLEECSWRFPSDVNSDSFVTWRAKQTKAAKTLNEYLAAMSAFLSWMGKHQRLDHHPLRHVGKVQTNGRQVRKRRAFTDEEMRRLLAISGARRVVYLTAVYTGLRCGELSKLERDAFHLNGQKPVVNVPASITKNRQQAVLLLHPDLVVELRELLAELPARQSRVFEDLLPTMYRFKADLKAAGIEFLDTKGRRADFHSLRHTLATNLALSGAAPRIAMEVMRHSDMRLTTKTYTDAGLLPVSDAVLGLPSLMNTGKKPSEPYSQIDSQKPFREGQSGSLPVTNVVKGEETEPIGNEALSLDWTAPVPAGQKGEKVAGLGFEPRTFRL